MPNKIGWCDMTWNPVWGCRNHCEYCYARGIAKRFGERRAFWEMKFKLGIVKMLPKRILLQTLNINDISEYYELKCRLQDFKLTFSERQFDKKFPKKPQRIFVGSMSEIKYWEKRWMEVVLGRILCYPQHTFQFLTKHPEVYSKYNFPKNCWVGVTIVRNPKEGESDRWDYYQFKQDNPNNLKFVCFEPLLMDMQLIYFLNLEEIEWAIIGAETGNRKGKVIPKLDWVLEIVRYCEHNKIPIYIKDNLVRYYHDCIGYKEFPKGVK